MLHYIVESQLCGLVLFTFNGQHSPQYDPIPSNASSTKFLFCNQAISTHTCHLQPNYVKKHTRTVFSQSLFLSTPHPLPLLHLPGHHRIASLPTCCHTPVPIPRLLPSRSAGSRVAESAAVGRRSAETVRPRPRRRGVSGGTRHRATEKRLGRRRVATCEDGAGSLLGSSGGKAGETSRVSCAG